jgi:hypothetical protein
MEKNKKENIRTLIASTICIIGLLFVMLLSGYNANTIAMENQGAEQDTTSQQEKSDYESPKEMQVSILIVSPGSEQGESSDKDGVFPPVWASFRESIGFQAYFREMKKRGAVFFFYSPKQNDWVEITDQKQLIPFDIQRIGKEFVDTPNILKNEQALSEIVARGQALENLVYLARPLDSVARFQSQISKQLSEKGYSLNAITGIKGIYLIKGGKLYLTVKSIALEEAGEIKTEFEVEVN